MRRGLSVAAVAACALLVGACGSDDGGGRGATLNWWAYNEPSGSFRQAADRCTKESGGRYKIVFNALGNDADTQRQPLVRRLAAKDSSIDLMSMDVIWTAEFAEAGWIKPWPEESRARSRKGTLKAPRCRPRPTRTSSTARPANTNTQLLWYRKDLVKTPPKTWDEMIDMASKMPKAGRIEIQGAAVRGLHGVVQLARAVRRRHDPRGHRPGRRSARAGRARALRSSRSSRPPRPPTRRSRTRRRTRTASRSSRATPPSRSTTRSSIRAPRRGNPAVFKQHRVGAVPGRRRRASPPRRRSAASTSASAATPSTRDEAFEAAACLRNEREPAPGRRRSGGLPPTLEAALRRPEVQEGLPVRGPDPESLGNGAVAPATPGLRRRLARDRPRRCRRPPSIDAEASVDRAAATRSRTRSTRGLL